MTEKYENGNNLFKKNQKTAFYEFISEIIRHNKDLTHLHLHIYTNEKHIYLSFVFDIMKRNKTQKNDKIRKAKAKQTTKVSNHRAK